MRSSSSILCAPLRSPRPLRLRWRWASAACVFAAGSAFAGSPRVNHTFPAVGQRGTEIEVECKGGNLADAKSLLFDAPGFETTIVKAEAGKLTAKIKIPADARLGEHSFRAITATGVADLKLFFVSPFPVVAEVEPTKDEPPAKAQIVPLGTTIYGRTQNEDQDRFEVEAKKGQRITAEVIGAKLQTQQIYDPSITIAKADGTLLAEVDDTAFGRQDPVASILAPEDGKYLVAIKEATNAGQGDCEYVLHLGSFARPLAVYPAGGPAGEELAVKLIGDSAGVMEKSVKLPGQPEEKFEVFSDKDQPAPTPNLLRVSACPNVLEAEPNNEWAKATPGADLLPIALNGIIEEKGDVDFFKFTAKKGQAYNLSVFARQLRSPLDSVLSIHDAKGSQIQQNDDDGQMDSHLRWSAPADGDFYASVKDQLGRGGPLFTYRVEIMPVQPQVTVWLPEMVINSSQERRAVVVPRGNRYATLVRVKRGDIGGDLELASVDLPSGVKSEIGKVDKAVDTIPMVFEAAAESEPAAKAFTIQAKLTEPPKDGPAVPSEVRHDVDVAENGNQKAFYSIREDKLTVAVIEEAPVKLTLEQPKVPILQNGSMNLKVKVERSGDFKGPIAMALLYAPPGIGSPGTVNIPEGQNEGTLTISANDKAALQIWKICVVGSADFGKGPVWISTQLADLEVAAPFVAGKVQRTFVDQGDTTTVKVALEQKAPFEGKAKVTLQGLPQGCTAQEQEITKDDAEAKFTVKAAPDAQAGQHKQLVCQFKLMKNGEEMTSTFANGGVLRVDKGTVAKNEPAK